MAYYETVAQVIAIIFLALAFEARTADDGRTYPGVGSTLYSGVSMLILLVLLSVGEVAALLSLAEARDTGLAKGITAVAVACGGIRVIAPIWARQREAALAADRPTWLETLALCVGGGIGVATLLLALGG